MKKNFTIVILLFFLINFQYKLSGQGFDWQYSPRLPFETPTFFVGLNGNLAYYLHNGSIDFREIYKCCTFTYGAGFGSIFGINAEYWQTATIALSGSLSYMTVTGDFQADGEALPVYPSGLFFYKNEFNTKLSYITIEMDAKYRLFLTHFFAGVGIRLGFLVSNKSEFYEKIVSPPEARFNDGSQRRTIANGVISDVQTMFFTPKLNLGYDLDLGLGTYSSIALSAGLPIINISKDSEWLSWIFQLNIKIFRGW